MSVLGSELTDLIAANPKNKDLSKDLIRRLTEAVLSQIDLDYDLLLADSKLSESIRCPRCQEWIDPYDLVDSIGCEDKVCEVCADSDEEAQYNYDYEDNDDDDLADSEEDQGLAVKGVG